MPLTRLQAVNRMLTPLGESVILVEVEGAGDYANCSEVLDQTTQDVLLKDWQFNTEIRTLTPDADGKIAVGPEVLKIDPVYKTNDYVQRGAYLYDRGNKTDVFKNPVDVKVTLLFRFEDCPFHVQRKIVADAAARYQRGYVGSRAADEFMQQDRAEAGADTEAAEADVDNYNVLEDDPDMAYLYRRAYRPGII